MNTIRILAAAICLMAAGIAAQAQQTINASTLQLGKAESEPGHPQYLLNRCGIKLLKSKYVTQHNILRDQQPQEAPLPMKQYCDVIHFSGKAKKLRPIIKSFNDAFAHHCADSACYRCVTFNSGDKARAWKLIYGDSPEAYVEIGSTTSNQMNYTFACFTDLGWPDYRTCYAIEWYDTGKTIFGRFIKTYARIPQPETSSNEDGLWPGSISEQIRVINKEREKRQREWSRILSETSGINGLEILGDSTIAVNGKVVARIGQETPFDFFGSQPSSDRYLRSFNILSQQFLQEETVDPGNLAALSIYTLLKEAATAKALSDDERSVVCSQLKELMKYCESRCESYAGQAPTVSIHNYYSTSRDYFRLAIKVLGGKP